MQKLQNDLTLPRPVPTLSIGACVAHDLDQIESPEQIIEAADECLYFAKRDGRNRSFTTELGVESVVSC
jgi:GGDEF domain-containing protein